MVAPEPVVVNAEPESRENVEKPKPQIVAKAMDITGCQKA